MEVVRRQPDVHIEGEAGELLGRLERHAAESGRLMGRVEALEDAVRTERDARRRLAATLKRERKAAEALYERAQRAEATCAAQAEELERLRQAAALLERSQRSEAHRQIAWGSRPLWRRLLGRPPST
jgi:hypothetical protein